MVLWLWKKQSILGSHNWDHKKQLYSTKRECLFDTQRQLMPWWGQQQIKWQVPKKLKVETLQHQPVYGPGLTYRHKTGRCEVQNLLQLFPCIRGKHRTVFLRVAAGLPQSLLVPCPRAPREHSGSQCTAFRVTGTQNWGISMFQRQVMQQKSHNVPEFPLKIVLCTGVYASLEWCGIASRDWAQKDVCSNPRHNNTVRKTRGHSSLALGCSPSMEVLSHFYGDRWNRCYCMPIGEVKTKWPKQRILVKIENLHFVSLTCPWFNRGKWGGSDISVFPRCLAYRRYCKVTRATDFVINKSAWHNWLEQGWYPRRS